MSRNGSETWDIPFFLIFASAKFLAVLVAAAEIVDEHLLNRLVISHENVAHSVSANEMADFFGEILGVVAGALERLGHEDDLQASLTVNVLRILDMAQEDQVAQAVHFSVGAQNVNGFGDLAGGECSTTIGEHFFQDGRHLSEIASVLRINAASGGLSAVAETEQKITDALKANHEFHAGQELASLSGVDFGDGGGDAGVDFHVESIEFALALTQGTEERGGAGGDAFGRSASGFLGETASFDGSAHDVLMGRFGIRAFDGSAHE